MDASRPLLAKSPFRAQLYSCFCIKISSTIKNIIYTIKNHNNLSETKFERFQSPYSSSPSCPAFFSCNNGPSCFLPLGFSSYLPEFDPFKYNSRNFRTSITAPKCGGFDYAVSSACTGVGLTTVEASSIFGTVHNVTPHDSLPGSTRR